MVSFPARDKRRAAKLNQMQRPNRISVCSWLPRSWLCRTIVGELIDHRHQFRATDGFRGEWLDALAEIDRPALDGRVDDADDLDLWVQFPRVFQRLRAVQSWHAVVQEDKLQIFPAVPQYFQPFRATVGRQHPERRAGEQVAYGFQIFLIVVNDQHDGFWPFGWRLFRRWLRLGLVAGEKAAEHTKPTLEQTARRG